MTVRSKSAIAARSAACHAAATAEVNQGDLVGHGRTGPTDFELVKDSWWRELAMERGYRPQMDLSECGPLEFLNLTIDEGGASQSTIGLWFAVDGDRVVTMLTDSRPADVLREHPRVLVSFSDRRGDFAAEGVAAVARPLEPSEAGRVGALLNEKYTWRRRSFRSLFWFTRRLGSAWDAKDHAFELQLLPDVAPVAVQPEPEAVRRPPMSSDDVATVMVDAVSMKRALDHLTEVAVPLGIRVCVDDDVVEFSFHDPERGWWATTRCRGSNVPSTASHTQGAVTVPRLVLREAIELAQLDATSSYVLAVRDGESVHVGNTAVAASHSWPAIPAPPASADHTLVHHDVALPSGPWGPDEKVAFVADGTRLTAMSDLLERFVGRDIRRVDVYRDEGSALLVGVTTEENVDDRLVLLAPAHVGP